MSQIADHGSSRHIMNGSRACIIWFAGVHETFLNPHFLNSYPGIVFDGLFFKDTKFDWYMGGFEGIAADFPASIDWLQALIHQHEYERVFVGGQSSGAYAALRVGHHIRPTAIIAFSPQTRNITNADGQMLPWVEVEDLSVTYSDWDASVPIYIHVARSEVEHKLQYFWDDWNQIKPFLEINNVTIIRHPFDVHVISIPLYDRGLLYKTILLNAMLYMPALE